MQPLSFQFSPARRLRPAPAGGQRMGRAVAPLVAAVLGPMLAPGGAYGQTAEQPLPPLAQERGVRTGEFVLHPSLAVMGHHDTNLFNGNNDEAGNKPLGATSLRIVPRLQLANDPNSNVTLSFSGVGDARIYFAGDNAAIAAQQNVGGNIGLDITAGQRRSFSLTFFDYFNRALRANNWETTQTFNRIANDVGARIEFHPGDIPERRPFNVAFTASYAFDWFDEFSAADSSTVRTRLVGSWKFLPKTAGVLDATWDFRSYDTGELASRNLAFNSKPFRAKVGLTGMLTKRMSAQALAGWGLSTHAAGSSFNNYLASIGVGVRASESTRLHVGYDHDFIDSFLSNYSDVHRFGGSLRQRFGQIMDVTAQFTARILTYGDMSGIKGNADITGLTTCSAGKCRRDTALDGSLIAGFEVARLLSMNIGYTLRSVQTNFKVVSKTNKAVLDAGAYTGHEIFASLALRY